MAVDAIYLDSWARRDVYARGRTFAVDSLQPSTTLRPFVEPLQSALSDSSTEQSAAIIWSAVHATSCSQNGHWLSRALASTQSHSTVVSSPDNDVGVAVADSSADFLRRVEEQLRQTLLPVTTNTVSSSSQLHSEISLPSASAISSPDSSTTAVDSEGLDFRRGSGARAEPADSNFSTYDGTVTATADHSDDVVAFSRRRSAGILRKKSVDLGNTRPRSKSEPSRRRSVHFSDSKGLPLVQAKEPDDWPCLEDPRTSPQRLRPSFQPAASVTPCDFSYIKSIKCAIRMWRIEGAQPSDCADFELRLARQQVCLERAEINRAGRLHGVVRVVNLAFAKTVFIRLSVDGWRSSVDVPAAYCGSPGVGLDRFAFGYTLNISPDEDAGRRASRCEFAICYRFLDMEHWDNNNTRNYALTCDR